MIKRRRVTINEVKIGDIYNNSQVIQICKNNIYQCKCLKCGNISNKYGKRGLLTRSCSVCSNKKIIKGYNDSLTTNPNLWKYVVNEDEFRAISYGSGKYVQAKCPDCGFQKRVAMTSLSQFGFSCPKCGDGISFPNKIMLNFLEQNSVDFETEKRFDWSGKQSYDFYLPSYNAIIENHGKQHYKSNGFISVGGRSLYEEQLNDSYKKINAQNHGIQKYFEINCMYSDIDYIKQSIINSGLFDMLKAKNIDWNQCLEYANKNLVKEVCELFNEKQGMISTAQIGQIYHKTHTTISSYLKIGTKLGWCQYDPKQEMRRIGSINGHGKSIQIICYEYPDIIHTNAKECCKYFSDFGIMLDENSLRSTCRGLHKTYKNLHFFYYDRMKYTEAPCINIINNNEVIIGINIMLFNQQFYIDEKYILPSLKETILLHGVEKIIGKKMKIKYQNIITLNNYIILEFPICVEIITDDES